jgi:hypothetical protein
MSEASQPVNEAGKDAIIGFRPLVMEPAINRLEAASRIIAPTCGEL